VTSNGRDGAAPVPPAPLKGPVLVATNLSAACDEAVRQADALARALHAPLVACHVLPEVLQVRMLFPQLRERDRAGAAQLESDAAWAVRQRIQDLTGRRPDECRVIVESGSPHAGILRQAEATGAGITVVGPGRVAERVVRTACCAVLIARPSPAGSVLAATDFSDPALPAVAAGAFEAARRGVGFAVIHSVDVLVKPVVAPLAGYPVLPVLSREERESLGATTLASLRDSLERVQASGTPIVAEGPPVTAILEAARTLPAELIVVGTHGRTGMTRLALGSVAEDVVHSAPCSTLVVRLHPA
jgi:universal stress protein A